MDTTSSGRPVRGAATSRVRAAGQLIDALRAQLGDLATGSGAGSGKARSVLDCGGGSGSLAVPLAVDGAMVTVLDISIDALSTLERRAAEAGVGDRVSGIQAEVEELGALVEARSFDVVLLHGILASAADARAVFAAAAGAVCPGGYLSVVVANPAASVLARAFSGDLGSALLELRTELQRADDGADTGTTLASLAGWVESEGFQVRLAQGLASFSSTVPGAVLSASGQAVGLVAELDRLTATRSPYRDIAANLHVIAQRPGSAAAAVGSRG